MGLLQVRYQLELFFLMLVVELVGFVRGFLLMAT
jgi:hypothetical protein